MEIRRISEAGIADALDLVWKVFLEFEAPEYSQEGIDEFKMTIERQAENLTFEVYGAFEEDELLGVIATRNEGTHISLFFVRTDHQDQRIGRKLFEHVAAICDSSIMTVFSSPYAVKIYRKLGFSETDVEQVVNGIRYVPMKYEAGGHYGSSN